MSEKTITIEYRVIQVDTDNSNKVKKLDFLYSALKESFASEEEAWEAIADWGKYGDCFTVIKAMKVQ